MDDSLIGVDLLKSLRGVHPIELKSELEKARELELLKLAFAGLEVTRPLSYEIVREDNPAFYFWPFKHETSQLIARYAEKFNSIALLGVPTAFSLLQNHRDNVFLFDQDDYFFGASAKGFVRCNLLTDLSEAYASSFDLVVADPPWYEAQYYSWLETALRIAKPGGTIIFVLFPEWIRQDAFRERHAIVEAMSKTFSKVSIEREVVEYETPSFEKVQLIANNIAPVDWRTADLVVARVPCEKASLADGVPAKTDTVRWEERRVGCGRVFVKVEAATAASEFLKSADVGARFLLSPSMRSKGRKSANILSSRGHGLICSDTELFLKLIDGVHSFEDVERLSLHHDVGSAELLKEVIRDLWPRYLSI